MKKALFILSAVAVFGLSSCSKNYTCECVTSVSGVSTSTTTSVTIKDSKKKATEACDKLDATSTTLGITQTVACSIK